MAERGCESGERDRRKQVGGVLMDFLAPTARASTAADATHERERFSKSKQCVDAGMKAGVQAGLITAVTVAVPTVKSA